VIRGPHRRNPWRLQHLSNRGDEVAPENAEVPRVHVLVALRRHRDRGKEPLAVNYQRKDACRLQAVAEQTGILTKEPLRTFLKIAPP
jgi:hypothetical protein